MITWITANHHSAAFQLYSDHSDSTETEDIGCFGRFPKNNPKIPHSVDVIAKDLQKIYLKTIWVNMKDMNKIDLTELITSRWMFLRLILRKS